LPAELIDGASIAREVRADVARDAAILTARGIRPGLAVVLVGDDPASAVYVRSKGRATEEAGMHSVTIRLLADTTEADLLGHVDRLNADAAIHGILVQMPLPKHIMAERVIRRIRPDKDVDGFHPINVGKLLIGERDGFAPCTPAGVQELLRRSGSRRGCRLRHRRAEHDRRQADGRPDDAGCTGRQRDGHRMS